jgi:hypothetical protein
LPNDGFHADIFVKGELAFFRAMIVSFALAIGVWGVQPRFHFLYHFDF